MSRILRCTGTAAGYRSGCKCAKCTAAINAYNRDRRQRLKDSEKESLRYPSHEARQHVKYLQDHGVTQVAIAEFAGVSPSVVKDVVGAKRPYVSERSYHAIMGVTIDAVRERGRVPGWKAQRLVSAIREAGIDRETLAAMMRYDAPSSISWIFGPQTVERKTIDKLTLIVHHLANEGRISGILLDEVTK